MTELERKALMGDKKAQEECTRQGVVLPCPCCKNKSELLVEENAFDGETPRMFHYIRCKSCFLKSGLYTSVIAVLNKWNTRPAPPIGRCGECKYYKLVITRSGAPKKCQHPLSGLYRILSENDYCNYFEPKGDEENA